MVKKILIIFVLLSCGLVAAACSPRPATVMGDQTVTPVLPSPAPNPLSIEALKARSFPGSQLVIESELPSTATYTQFLASYKSDGLTIHGLLTIPKGMPSEGGWPAIIFNHGYIPPEQYRTTERYVAYVGGFASKGFVVFKPDYRGHGSSEGQATGAYYSPGYTIDVLNALASVRQLPEVNKDRIGMWGHSMGGTITLRAISVDPNIKAAVIWAGVVADYPQLLNSWHNRNSRPPSTQERSASSSARTQMLAQYGTPEQNPTYWDSISPWAGLPTLQTPIQLHHAKGDTTVPWEFSQILYDKLQSLQRPSEVFIYEGSDHNLGGAAFNQAMTRSVKFFQDHL